ncbi:MAG: hypothetical protein ACI86M_002396 [Saprospiraceae bacterium]|jgi:hypothetical protein
MKQTKLFLALRSLSKEEWKSLEKYVIMDTNEKSDTYYLFEYMKNKLLHSIDPKSKKEVIAEILPHMTDKSFLNLCSRTFILFEGWLVWYETKKDRNKCDVHLVKIYNRRGIFKLANQKYKRVSSVLLNEKTSNLKTNLLLHELYHYHYFSENPSKTENPNLLLDLIEAHELRHKEWSYIYMAQMASINSFKIDDYSDQILKFESSLNRLPDSETSIISSEIYDLVKNQDLKSLELIYEFLINEKITKGSDLEVFATLYGISLSQTLWNKNILADPKMVLLFYEYGLSSGVILNLGKISAYKFTHITTVISKTQKPEKCYEFINKWSGQIEEKYRESTIAMCIAKIKLEEKKYNDAIYQLRGQTFHDIKTQIEALTIEIMAMYEEKEWNLLSSRIHNFKRKLRLARGKTSRNIIEGQQNFLKVVEKLMSSNYKKVEIDLSKYKFLNHRYWLENHIKSKGFPI